MTPRLVRRKYSNGRFLLTVFKNGYKYKGMCANEQITISKVSNLAVQRKRLDPFFLFT